CFERRRTQMACRYVMEDIPVRNVWKWIAGVILLCGFPFGCIVVAGDPGIAGPGATFKTGVWAIPAGLPRHQPEDVVAMFDRIAQLGGLAQLTGKWSQENVDKSLRQMLSVAERKNLEAYIALELVKGGRDDAEWDLPKALKDKSFADAALKKYFKEKAVAIAG